MMILQLRLYRQALRPECFWDYTPWFNSHQKQFTMWPHRFLSLCPGCMFFFAVQVGTGHLVMQTTLAAWRKGCSAEVQVMELKAAFAAWSAFWLDEQGRASSCCHSPRCHSSTAMSWISLGVTEWPADRVTRLQHELKTDRYRIHIEQIDHEWERRRKLGRRDRPTFPSLKGTHPAYYPGFILHTVFHSNDSHFVCCLFRCGSE